MQDDLIHFSVAQHAHVCLGQNRLSDAAALYAWLVERRPEDLPARMSLAFALIQLDRVAEAARCLPALDHLPIPALQYLFGRIRAATGAAGAAVAFERFATLQRSEFASAQAQLA